MHNLVRLLFILKETTSNRYFVKKTSDWGPEYFFTTDKNLATIFQYLVTKQEIEEVILTTEQKWQLDMNNLNLKAERVCLGTTIIL